MEQTAKNGFDAIKNVHIHYNDFKETSEKLKAKNIYNFMDLAAYCKNNNIKNYRELKEDLKK